MKKAAFYKKTYILDSFFVNKKRFSGKFHPKICKNLMDL